MRQQINLYQDVLIDKPEPFQSRSAALLLLLTVILLALFAGFSYWQNQGLAQQLDRIKKQHEADSQRIAELEQRYPEPRKNVLLEEKIIRLEQEIKSQNEALNYFSTQDPQGNGKILAALNGLARHPLKGVWLNQVRLAEGGTQVRLSGSALKAEIIPDYLGLISENNIFGGQVFSRLSLNRVEKKLNQIDFTLESPEADNR